MRKLEEEVRTQRKKIILDYIIKNYINGRGLSSSQISRELDLNLSPQSVRLIIEELEDEGMLFSRHKSDKKTPTNKALHTYLSTIKNARLNLRITIKARKIDEVLKYLSKKIAEISNSLGMSIVILPEKIKIDSIKILEAHGVSIVVFIFHGGFIYEEVVYKPLPDELEEILNNKLKKNNNYIDENLINELGEYEYIRDVFKRHLISGIYAPGEYAGLREIFENRRFLNEFLRKEFKGSGETVVKICDENEIEELKEYSIVYSGLLGCGGCGCVIGRRDMNYVNAIAAVNEAKNFIFRILNG